MTLFVDEIIITQENTRLEKSLQFVSMWHFILDYFTYCICYSWLRGCNL